MENYQATLNRLDAFTPADFKGHEVERLHLLDTARKLLARLETIEERVYNLTFHPPTLYAAMKTCVDLGIWRGWMAVGGGEKSLKELAELADKDCDLNLLRRLLRLLSASNIIEETGEDRYKPTPLSLALGDKSSPIPLATVAKTYLWDPSLINLPLFLAKTSYREPEDAKYTNINDGTPEGLTFFERNETKKIYQDTFSAYMDMWIAYRLPWPQFYDTTALLNGADLSAGPLIVDIGGHHGHDLLRVLDKHPNLPDGSLVIQDLPEVLTDSKLSTPKIKLMPHSFFDVEPVHGSRAYFFHGIFHDWPDATAIQILRNLIPAMKKGYSKLLICDVVLPPTGTNIYQATMDINMMAHLSAYERSESRWRKLITEAGFNVIKIWMDARRYEGVIEAELA
ncbi:putative O-methyltransferase [Hypoxylon trugodes]|uniref:putative O-methyltransferase n=1 Tax=Hypoxylon trugodes TaxID=326681 RepID=UPI00218F032D|nr:putative O-methyltransferase [Hypoxylon trugodes]KAI1387644.1 putative O-methyltransferase [Hypoxylon trugodes]